MFSYTHQGHIILTGFFHGEEHRKVLCALVVLQVSPSTAMPTVVSQRSLVTDIAWRRTSSSPAAPRALVSPTAGASKRGSSPGPVPGSGDAGWEPFP